MHQRTTFELRYGDEREASDVASTLRETFVKRPEAEHEPRCPVLERNERVAQAK
jgi:hypothetical protein